MTNSSNNPARKDVLIIGGGAAGLSAFHWCHELGMSCVLLEQHRELGGQLLSVHNPILNYLGRTAANGRELLGYFLAQIEDLENGAIINDPVIEFDPQQIRATLSGGRVAETRSAILATGGRRRRLGIPGEKEFVGRGILESGALEKRSVTGKRVA